MPSCNRGDRGALIALIAALAAVVLVAYFNQPFREPVTQKDAATVEEYTQDNISQSVSGPDSFHFWNDPFPQWVMAIFSIFATGISWLAVVYIRDTLNETRKAVKAAEDAVVVTREIGELQVRAYPSFLAAHIVFDEMTWMWICYLRVANTGNSPMQSVVTNGILHLYIKQHKEGRFAVSEAEPSPQTDLGGQGQQDYPIEFVRPPMHKDLVPSVTGVDITIEMKGTDVFGHPFHGRFEAMFTKKSGDWTTPHRVSIKAASTKQPAYEKS